jgi:murein DD-endopeptidase MepM/ murein hydrolase activator NlpD
MTSRGRARLSVCAAVVAVALVFLAGPSDGQVLEDDPFASSTTSTTTTAPSTTTTTADSSTTATSTTTTTTTTTTLLSESSTTTTAPPQYDPVITGGDSTPPPEGSGGPEPDGDGGQAPAASGSSRAIPPEAQRIIDSVRRTPPNGSAALLDAVQDLVDLGLSQQEAIRIGFGRFPVAGPAKYSHDWLFPRYGPGFRFHLGTDVFAPFGTPLRSPVDGTVTSGTGSLGGLYMKVFMDDGTYFYFAHMSGLVDGFADGMAVRTGDIVGYVGDSGNAKGTPPHLHIGVYPQGGPATDPKPILDQFLADAMARLPEVVEQVRAKRPVAPPAEPSVLPAKPTTPRSLLATSLLRPFTERPAAVDVPTEVLYQSTGNPSAGGVSVARSGAEQLAASIDWEAWASRTEARRALIQRTVEAIRLALGPITAAGRTSAVAAP